MSNIYVPRNKITVDITKINNLSLVHPDFLKSTDEIVNETNNLRDLTRESGYKILQDLDSIEDISNVTKKVITENTERLEDINDELNKINTKIKKSKKLIHIFNSLFICCITQSSDEIIKTNKLKESTKSKEIIELHNKVKYDLSSEDPAEQIAIIGINKLNNLENYVNDFNNELKKQNLMLDTIQDKTLTNISKIDNVTKQLKQII
jgi:hypothetical protein